MPNTPKGLTYPSNASPVAVPADIQELATDVDNIIVPISGGTYSGAVAFLQNPSVPTPTSALHAVNKTYADAINADVTALENELGANPSGTFSTVVQRLDTYTTAVNKVGNLLKEQQALPSDDSWFYTSSTKAITSDGLTITATGSTAAVYTYKTGITHESQDYTVIPGETYTVYCEVKTDGASQAINVGMEFYNSSGTYVGQIYSGQTSTVADTWVTINKTVVAPANSAYAVELIYFPSTVIGTTHSFRALGVWKGYGGKWSAPGSPIIGLSEIAKNGAVNLSGTGAPEGTVSAALGSTYLQVSGAATVTGMMSWRKTGGGTGSTGWSPEGALADTGWRDVSGSLSNLDGSNAGTLKVARRGSRVVWEFSNLLLASGSGALALWTSIPTGFRADKPIFASGSAHRINSQVYLQSVAVNSTAISWNSETNLASGAATATRPAVGITGQMSYDVISGWPTSLPGVAV